MIAIFLLIPLSIVIATCFLVAYFWAVKSGQYEDTGTPPLRLLLDDKHPSAPEPKALSPNPKTNHP